jgi:hypothetical protein
VLWFDDLLANGSVVFTEQRDYIFCIRTLGEPGKATQMRDATFTLLALMHLGYHDEALKPYLFFPHFVSSISPIVPPEIVSPSMGLPRKMILVFNWYPFGPNLFQALHGASMRHSLNVLAVQVKVCLGSSSAKLGAVAPISNADAINTVEFTAHNSP